MYGPFLYNYIFMLLTILRQKPDTRLEYIKCLKKSINPKFKSFFYAFFCG